MASLNNVNLLGRLTSDVTLQKSKSGVDYTSFSIACDRHVAKKEGIQTVDFIRVSAFGQSAKYLADYAHKGDYVSIEGTLQSNTREVDGKNQSTIGVVANRVGLIAQTKNPTAKSSESSQEEIDISSMEIPF